MEFHYKSDYTKLTDKQIVEKILAEPHDEEAAAYLLYDRYDPLLRSLYRRLTNEEMWFNDCVDELFILLKGRNGSWNVIANFGWRSSFGYWLKEVAWNKFREVLSKVIENEGHNLSIENSDHEHPKIQIAAGGEESLEHRLRKVMLLEAIGKLKDYDQRFVILKRLEGYRSKEVAVMLQEKWQKEGIKKHNNDKQLVIPDENYVNVLIQRAKKMLKRIMNEQ